MPPPSNLLMRVRTPGQRSFTLRPGEKLTIGRHGDNDIVLVGGLVSRHHAQVVWDADEDRPYIEDLQSANGVEVDDELIDERHYLIGESTQVDIGDHLLVFELDGASKRATSKHSAALVDSGVTGERTTVALFSDKHANIEGRYEEVSQLKRAMVLIEDETRTGTLRVTCGAREFKLTFMQGRVITALGPGGQDGRAAFGAMLGEPTGHYRFSREVEPSEANLDISPNEEFSTYEDTTRIRPSPPRD